ncbi:hypothetical protein BRADI_4g34075v3 [Brachypodium distachyon]|uniref:Uncharacterized protein n=2 Tax=Brachypodium distachyon TaxID=15368 RepID=A0A2K2CS73_BRADI|nr:hypothetical protein BRADI_4g34075v3 [Brachypodium distachyon]
MVSFSVCRWEQLYLGSTTGRCARYDGEFVVAARKLVDGPAPATAALKAMIAGLFRPLFDNFHQLRSLKTVFDTEDYHIGMPFGALLACIACHKLWKMDPSTFLDAALGYAFYRLSVLSSQVRRQGFSNDFISRIKFIIVLIMAFKDIDKKIVTLDCIRAPVWFLYLTTFVFDVKGLKKHARSIFYQKYMSSFKPRKADSVYDWSYSSIVERSHSGFLNSFFI